MLLHEVEAGDLLGHGVLDLEAGVHLEEGELPWPGRRHDVFDRAGIHVADAARQADGRIAELLACRLVKEHGGRLLDDLLVAALQGALALPQVQDSAVGVGEHLHLDVARRIDEALDEESVIAEGRERLAPCTSDRCRDVIALADHAHALAAAAGRGLEQSGSADLLDRGDDRLIVHPRVMASGHHRHARGNGRLLGCDLVAHRLDDLGAGTDEDQARLLAGAGEGRVLRQEAVAGVDGLRT